MTDDRGYSDAERLVMLTRAVSEVVQRDPPLIGKGLEIHFDDAHWIHNDGTVTDGYECTASIDHPTDPPTRIVFSVMLDGELKRLRNDVLSVGEAAKIGCE